MSTAPIGIVPQVEGAVFDYVGEDELVGMAVGTGMSLVEEGLATQISLSIWKLRG